MTDSLTLTPDQQRAEELFIQFLANPVETVFVLSGYSGTGKSTLVRHLLDNLDGYRKTIRLINPHSHDYAVQLTATTNKAAENLMRISGQAVRTIHSFLGLRVNTDYRTGLTSLVPRTPDKQEGYLLFIDEASMIDPALLQMVFEMTERCKIVFIGDPAQLPPVKFNHTPVFSAGFPGASLTQVMRQLVNGVPQANPITELATLFRETVNTGAWPKFVPDGQYVQWLPRNQFEDAILAEFTRPDWRYHDSKVLAWTNKCVIGYNNAIRDHVTGDANLQEGDYAVCNKFVQLGRDSIKTDQMVYVSEVEPETAVQGLVGHYVTLDERVRCFWPKSIEARKKLLAEARANDNVRLAMWADNLIDLRAAYAQTINKSQGSTYGRVFIDLDDLKRCNMGNMLARLLYVGVSRAREQVVFTGDLV